MQVVQVMLATLYLLIVLGQLSLHVGSDVGRHLFFRIIGGICPRVGPGAHTTDAEQWSGLIGRYRPGREFFVSRSVSDALQFSEDRNNYKLKNEASDVL